MENIIDSNERTLVIFDSVCSGLIECLSLVDSDIKHMTKHRNKLVVIEQHQQQQQQAQQLQHQNHHHQELLRTNSINKNGGLLYQAAPGITGANYHHYHDHQSFHPSQSMQQPVAGAPVPAPANNYLLGMNSS